MKSEYDSAICPTRKNKEKKKYNNPSARPVGGPWASQDKLAWLEARSRVVEVIIPRIGGKRCQALRIAGGMNHKISLTIYTDNFYSQNIHMWILGPSHRKAGFIQLIEPISLVRSTHTHTYPDESWYPTSTFPVAENYLFIVASKLRYNILRPFAH